jgi:hypothetical protein
MMRGSAVRLRASSWLNIADARRRLTSLVDLHHSYAVWIFGGLLLDHRKLFIVAACAACAAAPSYAFAQNAQEEAQKQASRLISQAITDRIGATEEPAAAGGPATGPAAAGDNAVWGLVAFTNLEFGDQFGLSGDSDSDLFLGTAGWDTRQGERTLWGLALTYSRFEGFGSTTDGFSITPYFGYTVTDHFFWSSLVSFGRSTSESDIGGQEFSSVNISAEVAANLHTTSGPATWRGKLAYRPAYFDADNFDSDWSSSVALFGEGQFALSQGVSVYANAELSKDLEDNDNERLPIALETGVLFRPNDRSEFGIGYQTVVNDDFVDISTINVKGRVRF